MDNSKNVSPAKKQPGDQQSAPKPEAKPAGIYKLAMEWGVPLILAVGAALLIKWQVADVYIIPTGSMEPTLHGVPYAGDRIFCNKLAYSFRKDGWPKRWEVFVFKYPGTGEHAGEYYVKRCLGLPGETVYMANGDIYIQKSGEAEPLIAKKPLELQDSIWIPVNRQDFTHKNSIDAFLHHWSGEVAPGETQAKAGGEAGKEATASRQNESGKTTPDSAQGTEEKYTVARGALVIRKSASANFIFSPRFMEKTGSGSDGKDEFEDKLGGVYDRHVKSQVVDFTCPHCGGKTRQTVETQQLTAFCSNPKCGEALSEENIALEDFPHPGLPGRQESPPRGMALHAVRDLRLTLDLRPAAAEGELVLALSADDEEFNTIIPLSGGKVKLLRNDEPAGEGETIPAFSLDKPTRCEIFRCDGTIYVRLDGKVALTKELSGKWPGAKRYIQSSSAAFGLRNAGGEVASLAVDRDIHYFFGTPYETATGYYAKFRNTPNMKDKFALMNRDECYLVPERGFLAIGDNSPTSHDSRFWGPVPEANLVGPALFVWWPPHRVRIIE